jgi:sulfite reductase (NADPH) flavoprotein alpha-component
VILSVSFPGLPALVPACALLFIGAAVWLARRRSRARRRARPVPTPSDVVLVLHASQTGTARALAQEAGEALRQAGRAVRVDGLGAIRSLDALMHRHVLLALSTTGDGEPPDDARPFVEAMLGWNGPGGRPLAGVSFGLLALGDRRYPDFCGFGQRVESWLRRRGASALFETIEVDGGSPADLARWHAALAAFVGVAPPPAWGDVAAAASRPWRLAWRGVLNPGSVGEPMVHLALEPADGAPAPDWQAGDIARVSVPTERWARDYSVASVPADGRLELVLRRIRRRNGRPGAASGWLSEAPPGSELALRLLPHPSFRLGDNADRPLILVGTGGGYRRPARPAARPRGTPGRAPLAAVRGTPARARLPVPRRDRGLAGAGRAGARRPRVLARRAGGALCAARAAGRGGRGATLGRRGGGDLRLRRARGHGRGGPRRARRRAGRPGVRGARGRRALSARRVLTRAFRSP